jgi:fibronectin-binding autotransporter adhesin
MHSKYSTLCLAASLMISGVLPASAASATWATTPADNTWANGANWGGSAPGNTTSGATSTSDVATFQTAISGGIGGSGNPIVIDSGRTIGGITFTGSAGAYVIGATNGNSLYLSSGGEIQMLSMSAATTETVNAPLVLGGNYTFADNSATTSVSNALVIGGSITNSGASGTVTLTLTGTNGVGSTSGTNVISGIISDGANAATAINFTANSAKWQLSNANTFSGGVTMAGTGYIVDTASSVTSGSPGSQTLVSGGLGTGTLTVSAAGRLVGTASNATTIANSVSLGASLTTQQSLIFNGTGLATPATINVTAANVIITADSALTINDTITGGTNGLEFVGTVAATPLIVAGATTYTGATTISGVVEIENGGAFGTNGAINFVSGNQTLQVSGNITGGTKTLSIGGVGATSTTGALENVSGNNSFSGQIALKSNGTVISSDSGTLSLNFNTANTPAIYGTTTGDGLVLAGAGSGSIAGVITGAASTTSTTGGAGTLTKNGTGTWTLSGSNSFTGGTTVNAGGLILNNTAGSATGTGALSVVGGATLGGTGISSGSSFGINGTGTTTSTIATVLVGRNSLTDTNTSGRLTLAASGPSTISNAQLNFNINTTSVGGSGNGTSANAGAGAAGTGNELLVGSTAITFGSGSPGSAPVTLELNLVGGTFIAANTPYVLIAGTGTNQYSGLATTLINGQNVITTGPGSNLDLVFANDNGFYTANSYLILYQAAGVDDIEVVVVPEPGTWAMMLGGLAMLFFWQRRQVRRS